MKRTTYKKVVIDGKLPDGKWTNTIWGAGKFIMVSGEKAIDERGIDLNNRNWAEDDEQDNWEKIGVKLYYEKIFL